MCTQIGESEYKKHGDELESEKKLEERIEAKIRILRKENNKARLHPTKEGGPSKKKRKIEKNVRFSWLKQISCDAFLEGKY